MITIAKRQLLVFSVILMSLMGYAQEEKTSEENKRLYRKLSFFDLRGTSTVDLAIGTSLINSDYPEPEFELYYRIGFKQYITDHLNIGLSFNKYNLAFNETFNEGFMSFDLNLEYLLSPYTSVSPLIFGGYGYNASNQFESTQPKAQVGAGIEFIVTEGVGLKVFGDYNYVLSTEEEGLIVPDNDESFIRIALGVNIYFGGTKKREQLMARIDTVINSNLIK